jgi:predicted aspartyl protease
MPAYDTDRFDPPAPVASVTLKNPATGASLSDVPMLMDSGADVTLIPREVADKLEIVPVAEKVYELQDFDGSIHLAEMALLELVFMRKRFKGQFLLTDQSIGILGRNILNAVVLLLDGPNIHWDEHKSNS